MWEAILLLRQIVSIVSVGATRGSRPTPTEHSLQRFSSARLLHMPTSGGPAAEKRRRKTNDQKIL
jgi:hypothetical protein